MSKTVSPREMPLPAEEPIMKRYSPHGEFPLSTVASIAIHLLGVGLLLIVGYLAVKFLGSENKPIEAAAVVLEEPGGGGGKVDGAGGGPGVGEPAKGDEAAPPPVDPDKPATTAAPDREHLKEVSREPLKFDAGDPVTTRLVEQGGHAVDAISSLTESARKKLQSAVAGQGQGGPGRGGGKGSGVGTGEGDGVGPGKGSEPTKRARRTLRWTLIFNTRDGNDYARQLEQLGAILAIPDGKEDYLVIRDLSARPAKPQVEDVSKINRIFWIDDRPSSVRSLAGALQIPAPRHFVAFFPADLEEKLLRLELGYRGRQEDEITETRFEVRKVQGVYEPVVVSQR
jgi:hypothetical protein